MKRRLLFCLPFVLMVFIFITVSSFSTSYFRFYKEIKVGKRPKFIVTNNTFAFVLNVSSATIDRITLKDFHKKTVLSLSSPVYMELDENMLLIADSSLNKIIVYNVSEGKIENKISTLPSPVYVTRVRDHVAVLSRSGLYFEWFSIKGKLLFRTALPVPAVMMDYKDNDVYIPLFGNFNVSIKNSVSPYGLSIIDLGRGKRYDYILGKKPLAIVFNGKYAYVNNYSDGTLCKFDLERRNVVKKVELGKYPFEPVIGNGLIFVPVLSKDAVAVLDFNLNLKKWLHVSIGPIKVLLSQDGRFVYILSCIEPALTIYDAITFKKLSEIKLKGYPIDMVVTPDEGYILIVDNDGDDIQVVRKF